MYVELTCKSNFSFLRGASDTREYVARAADLGMPAIGIADINGVYGLPRAYEALREFKTPPKLICGAEITVQNHPPVTLIAQTRCAWGLLCRIITQVHSGKEKGEGFITLDELEEFLTSHPGAPELICILQNKPGNNFKRLKYFFKDNLYLSLCRYLDGIDDRRTAQALDFAAEYGLALVAGNDVHYHVPERHFLQDCVTCIREQTTIDQAGFKIFPNAERYLKKPEEMQELFQDLPTALANTLKIADQCTFSLADLKYTYPQEAVPQGHTAASFLEELVIAGAKKRYGNKLSDEVTRQIRRELDFFSRRGEEDYFLTMNDILKDARDKKIVFQGRGSAASSIVCYTLGITAIEPLSSNLLFDRFANEARLDPPDIDVDFEHERREEVIQGIYERYGRDRAGMVAAIHTYQEKGAYREICKALGVEVGTLKADVVRARFKELARQYAFRENYVQILISQMAKSPRHLGTHSGGFVITNEPLVETVPIESARKEGRTIVQWDKHDLETLGMMKIDILSIGFLTVIRKACDLAQIDWREIPINDQKTYALIQRAETVGCFQIESRAQINSLPHAKPSTPYEMTVQVARIRPSMSKGGMSRNYIKGLREFRAGRPFRSKSKALENILRRTHGVAMFPEQIMQIAMDVCGFTSAEADRLRRSLGQERSAEKVSTAGERLYQQMLKCDVEIEIAQDVFDRVQGFASYGFPEAHAASYGNLAFKSAYLKCHYPAHLLCGLINSQPMGFYRIDFLINEAKRNSGVTVLPVHPNLSEWDAQLIDPKTLRMGFRDVRKIHEDDVKALVAERSRRPFRSIEDFISRNRFGKDVLTNLNLMNAFMCFGIDRRHAFWKSMAFKNLVGKDTLGEQLSLFDENTRVESAEALFKPMTALEKAVIDYRIVGYSLNGSLMTQIRCELPHLTALSSRQINQLRGGVPVNCAGIILVDQRPPPAQGFGFITLEDEYGTIDLVLRPQVYDQYKHVFRSSRFLLVTGKTQRNENQVIIKADVIESFARVAKVRSHQPTPRMLDRLEW